MIRKIAWFTAIVLIIALFGGCSGSKVNVTLDEIIKANSYEALVKEYGVYKLEYDYGSETENFMEFVSADGVLKLINDCSAYIYYGEKCCYYKSGDEIYALLNRYDEGKSYRDFGTILTGNNEQYHEELKSIERTEDGYVAVSVLNGENVVLHDGQKLTADDEIRYTMTLNQNLTVTALVATVKYATQTEGTDEVNRGDMSTDENQSSQDAAETETENEKTASTTIVDLEQEMRGTAEVGYERRLFSLSFDDSDDEDYASFAPYTTLREHANPPAENTVSITVFQGSNGEGTTYYCTRGDQIYVSDNGYYKDEARSEYCEENTVTANENINIYL